MVTVCAVIFLPLALTSPHYAPPPFHFCCILYKFTELLKQIAFFCACAAYIAQREAPLSSDKG